MKFPSFSNDKLLTGLGIIFFASILSLNTYQKFFPESTESLIRRSEASLDEAERKLTELENLGHEGQKIESIASSTNQVADASQNPTNENRFLITLRVVACCIGGIFLYFSLFLYEDKQGKIQNRLEATWVKIDDARKSSLSKHTVFINSVARILAKGIDSLLGTKSVSLQSVGVTICLAISFANLFLHFLSSSSTEDHNLVSSLYWLILAVIPALIRDSFFTKVWFLTLAVFIWNDFISGNLVLAAFANSFGISAMVVTAISILAGVALGCLFFFASIVIVRQSLKRISSSTSFWKTAIFPLLNCLPILVFYVIVNGFLFNLDKLNEHLGLATLILVFAILYVNFFFFFSAIFFFLISFFLFGHKIFWGILDRPIYTLQKLGIAKRSKLLGTAGALLMVAGVGGGRWVEKVIDKLNPL